MKNLYNLLTTEPNTNKIDLSEQMISNVSEILPLLKKFENLSILILSDNQLTYLPEDFINLVNLEELDLSHNPFTDFYYIISVLSNLPKLEKLRISIEQAEEASFVLQNLPNLKLLNGRETQNDTENNNENNTEEKSNENNKTNNNDEINKNSETLIKNKELNIDIEDNVIEKISLDNELENFRSIFVQIQEYIEESRPDIKDQFANQFQSLLNKEISAINELTSSNIPNLVFGIKVLMSKLKIYNFFSEVIVKVDKKGLLNKVQLNLIETKNKLIYETEDLNTTILQAFTNNNISETFNKLKDSYEDKLNSLTEELKFKCNELDMLKDNEAMLNNKIDKLGEENKKMTENLFSYSKILYNQNPKEKKIYEMSNTITSQVKDNLGKGVKINSISKEKLKNSNSTLNLKLNNVPKGKSNDNNNNSNNIVVVSQTGAKILTKKMLLEIIQDIYHNKTTYDKTCFDNKQPKETMEQYMYTYLNYKYGLKNLIIEWAISIINGIKTFSSEDSKVFLFGKILKNEIEEDFRFTFERLKKTIEDLLQHYIKAKYPMKNSDEIQCLMQSKINNNGYLKEEEWKGIIYYLYEENDAKLIEAKIINDIESLNNESNKYAKYNLNSGINTVLSHNNIIGREELNNNNKSLEKFKELKTINYFNFQKIILDFQIKCRVNYLKKFTLAFKSIDSDKNGIISENEFMYMLNSLSIQSKINIEPLAQKLLLCIDPFNHKQINYSDCINAFSKEPYYYDGKSDTVLNIVVSKDLNS